MVSLTRLHVLGSCRNSDDQRYVADDPHLHQPPLELAQLCGRCPVQGDCLEYALETEDPDGEAGIWGGMTQYQRQQLKRTRPRVYCPGCLSDAVVPHAHGEICLTCGMSWLA